MEEKFVNVQIPVDLYNRIEERSKEAGERSPTDYIIKTLEKNVAGESPEANKISEDDEEKIKERARTKADRANDGTSDQDTAEAPDETPATAPTESIPQEETAPA